MRLIKNTTELIGIKDQNIKISLVFETDTHIEIQAKLDYPEMCIRDRYSTQHLGRVGSPQHSFVCGTLRYFQPQP